MALNIKNLCRIAYGNGNALFQYKTTDPIATVVGAGYFNGASGEFLKGDTIIVTDTNVGTVDLLTVTSADRAAVVTVVNGT
jgi:hypothetical protein